MSGSLGIIIAAIALLVAIVGVVAYDSSDRNQVTQAPL